MAEIDVINKTDTTLKISWFILYSPYGNNRTHEFLPSIARSKDPKSWKNETWVHDPYYEFVNLTAYESYNITVYIRDKITRKQFQPNYMLSARTAQGGTYTICILYFTLRTLLISKCLFVVNSGVHTVFCKFLHN